MIPITTSLKKKSFLNVVQKLEKGDINNEDLHALRVLVKKMRTILLLLEMADKQDEKYSKIKNPILTLKSTNWLRF